MSAGKASEPSFLGRIKDGRGRKVTALNPEVMCRLHSYGLIPPKILRRIVERVGGKTDRANSAQFWALSSLVGLLIAVLIAESLQPFLAGTRIWRVTLLLVGPLSMLVVVLAIRLGGWLFTSEQTTRMMLKYYRCPYCGYDLRLLPVEPEDGVTICPECGCAWKLFYVYPAPLPEEDEPCPSSAARQPDPQAAEDTGKENSSAGRA